MVSSQSSQGCGRSLRPGQRWGIVSPLFFLPPSSHGLVGRSSSGGPGVSGGGRLTAVKWHEGEGGVSIRIKLPWKLRLAGSREQWVPLQSLSPCPPPPSSCQAWHLLLSKPSQNEKAGGAEHPLLLSPDLFPLEEDLCYPESETFLDLAVGGAFRRIRAVAGQGPHYSVPQGEG